MNLWKNDVFFLGKFTKKFHFFFNNPHDLSLKQIAHDSAVAHAFGNYYSKARGGFFVAYLVGLYTEYLSSPRRFLVFVTGKYFSRDLVSPRKHRKSYIHEGHKAVWVKNPYVHLPPCLLYAVRRARPFWRRRLTTRLPVALFVRARKP